MVLGFLAGQWVDGRLNTGIIFSLIGVLLGLVAAITSAVRLYRATLNKSAAEWRARATESAPDVTDENDDGDDK